MYLTFPNQSRSYDETGRRIRFSGYDGVFEIKFFLEIDALAKAFAGKMSGEKEYLSAFDTVRKNIQAVAEKAYARGKDKAMCTLTITDFA